MQCEEGCQREDPMSRFLEGRTQKVLWQPAPNPLTPLGQGRMKGAERVEEGCSWVHRDGWVLGSRGSIQMGLWEAVAGAPRAGTYMQGLWLQAPASRLAV